jgi:hypothetical protein
MFYDIMRDIADDPRDLSHTRFLRQTPAVQLRWPPGRTALAALRYRRRSKLLSVVLTICITPGASPPRRLSGTVTITSA